MRYAKAPGFIGRDLTIMVGRGNRTIRDGMILEGDEFEPFVKLGMLVRVQDPPVVRQEVIQVDRSPRMKEPEPIHEPHAPTQDAEPKASELLMTLRDAIDPGSITRAPDSPVPMMTEKRRGRGRQPKGK